MEDALKWYKRAKPLALVMAVLAVAGEVLVVQTPYYDPYAAQPELPQGAEPYLMASIVLSAVLMVLCLVLLVMGRKMGSARKMVMGRMAVNFAVLAAQIVYVSVLFRNPTMAAHGRVGLQIGYWVSIANGCLLPKIEAKIRGEEPD